VPPRTVPKGRDPRKRAAVLLAAGAILGQLHLPPSLEAALLAFLQALT
jgi:hypothetical protein